MKTTTRSSRTSLLLAVSLSALVVVACTVTRERVHPVQPAFDGNDQDSGYKGFTNIVSEGPERGLITNRMALVSGFAKTNFNRLALKYGSRVYPPVYPDEGFLLVGSNRYVISKQTLEAMGIMQYYENQEAAKETVPP